MANSSPSNYSQKERTSSFLSSSSNKSQSSSSTSALNGNDDGGSLKRSDSTKSKSSSKTGNGKPKSVFNLKKRPSFNAGGEEVDRNDPDSQNLTFLDRLRSQSVAASTKRFTRNRRSSGRSGSVSVLTSPVNIYGANNSGVSGPRSHYPSEGHDPNLNDNDKTSASLSRPTKTQRKWYSFTNLLSRQSLSNILSLPSRSRLSVSSIFTSDEASSSYDATPTDPSEPPGFGVFSFFDSGSVPNNYSSRNLNIPPTSPTPSCATVSGEYPSRCRQKSSGIPIGGTLTAITSPTSGSGLGNINSSSVILRRQNRREDCFNSSGRSHYGQQRSLSSGAASGVSFNYTTSSTTSSSTSTICAKNYSSSFSNNSKTAGTRLSCGEFFPAPGGSTSPGFLGQDFQFHFYTGLQHRRDSNGQQQARRSLGSSLPTLLETMESASNLQGSVEYYSPSAGLKAESVLDLLYQEFAILPGSKTKDDHYIIIFPDRGNFQLIGDEAFRRLMVYLTSVPSMQDAEPGFVLIVDRRNDKWNSVKTTLLRISGCFPALIHRVFVLRPVGFLQKALSEVSSKLFRTENLRFRLTVCNHVSDLISFIDPGQLIPELSGYLVYDKVSWTQQRIEVESFHTALQTLSRDLKKFTESFTDIEYPNDVTATERLIQEKDEEYNGLRIDMNQAADHGEDLLRRIKCFDWEKDATKTITKTCPATTSTTTSAQLVNVISVERFILQIEETTNLFEEFYRKEKRGLEQCLSLRMFEQDFKELQTSFDQNIKSLNDIPEMGESSAATNAILTNTINFKEAMMPDVDRAIELEVVGRNIVALNPSATDIVEPKCVELSRMASHFRFIIQEKISQQIQWKEVQSYIETANSLCTEVLSLVTSQQLIETAEVSPDWGKMNLELDSILQEIQTQIESLTNLKGTLNTGSIAQSKTLVKQILKRVEDVQAMCVKRQIFVGQQLEKLAAAKSRRTSGSSILSAANSAFHFDLKSTKSVAPHESQSDTSSVDGSTISSRGSSKANRSSITSSVSLDSTNSSGKSSVDGSSESRFLRRGHILDELLKTERTYVEEIGNILSGYRDQAMSSDFDLPSQLISEGNNREAKPSPNISVLFCNLDEIYSFHSNIFLPDLSNCIQSIDLVGLCFIQRHSDFLAMYSQYCQLMPSSESLLKEIGKCHPWLLKCQARLKQQLPLSSYLLKPVQRITKYHLLLKDLVKYSEDCNGLLEIQEALECMLVVLRSVNDGMHQLAIRGYPAKLPEEGPLLLQGTFTVWTETMKNRLRLKGHQRYLFLYQKSILVCKKLGQLPSVIYDFKNKINLSEVGITEALKGSGSSKKFEIWIQGRQKVFVLLAPSHEVKDMWVKEVKRLLFEQLESLRMTKGTAALNYLPGLVSANSVQHSHKLVTHKGAVINGWRSASVGSASHRPLRQVSAWETSEYSPTSGRPKSRSIENDVEEEPWSSDVSVSEDEESVASTIPPLPPGEKLKKSTSNNSISVYGIGEIVENEPTFVVFADYNPVGTAEIPLKEGDVVILVKVGCAGWWFVRTTGTPWMEGWAPSAYLGKHSSSSSFSASASSIPEMGLMMKKSSLPREVSLIPKDNQNEKSCSSMERKVSESLESKSGSVELR